MNKLIIPAFLVLLLTGLRPATLAGQSGPQPVFDRANSYLEQGNYREALSLYRQLDQQRRESGALYLNMAISYVELDSLGKAKYYFMEAEQFEETRPVASRGLEYVNTRFSRQSAVLPKLPWQQFFEWLNSRFGAVALLACGIILLNAGVFGFITRWFLSFYNRYLKIGGITAASLGILIVLTSFYLQYIDRRYDAAVMIHQQATVREQPESQAPEVSQAYEGYTFTVDRYESVTRPGWYYVRMSNGLYGWIPGDRVMVVDT